MFCDTDVSVFIEVRLNKWITFCLLKGRGMTSFSKELQR